MIIVGGGSGSRFGAGNKLLAELNGMPVYLHSLKNFSGVCDELIMAVPAGELEAFRDRQRELLPDVQVKFVVGGDTRTGSVRNALAHVSPAADFIAVHDAARPLASAELLAELLAAAREYGAAIPGAKVVDTIKVIDGDSVVASTPDRAQLAAVQTPQMFRAGLLRAAYANPVECRTDDAAMVEAAGGAVKVVWNNAPNLKITYQSDLELAGRLLLRR